MFLNRPLISSIKPARSLALSIALLAVSSPLPPSLEASSMASMGDLMSPKKQEQPLPLVWIEGERANREIEQMQTLHKEAAGESGVQHPLERPRLILFTAQWCSWCHRLEENFLSKEQVQQALQKHFVCIKLSSSSRASIPQEAIGKQLKDFEVQGFPTMVVLDRRGQEVTRWNYPRMSIARLVEQIEEAGLKAARLPEKK